MGWATDDVGDSCILFFSFFSSCTSFFLCTFMEEEGGMVVKKFHSHYSFAPVYGLKAPG